MKITNTDSRLGDARRTTGFKDIDRLIGVSLRDPTSHGSTAEPFVLEMSKVFEVGIPFNLFTRVKIEVFCVLQPERTSCPRAKVPFDDFSDVCIE